MSGRSPYRFWTIAVVGLLSVSALASIGGRLVLQKPVEGPPCPQLAEPAGVSFVRPGRDNNFALGRTLIRTRSGDRGAGCNRIGRSYNCRLTGPTMVEVRNDDAAQWFEVPAGMRAVLAGDTETTACTLIATGDPA